MPLPKTKHPLHPITIPSTKEVHYFRQFLVREEKILLTASQTQDKSLILRGIEQIIANCSMDEDFDTDTLTTFDFDYVFIRLRALSINNVIGVKYTNPDTGEEHDFKVNLDDVVVEMPNISNVIKTDEGNTIVLRYPSMKEMTNLLNNIEKSTLEGVAVDFLDQLLMLCIDKIYNDEEVFDNFSGEEVIEWFNEQKPNTYEGARQFLNNIPDVSYTIKYKEEEEDKELVLQGIDDFFTWQ
jgi:hypothetical protein